MRSPAGDQVGLLTATLLGVGSALKFVSRSGVSSPVRLHHVDLGRAVAITLERDEISLWRKCRVGVAAGGIRQSAEAGSIRVDHVDLLVATHGCLVNAIAFPFADQSQRMLSPVSPGCPGSRSGLVRLVRPVPWTFTM